MWLLLLTILLADAKLVCCDTAPACPMYILDFDQLAPDEASLIRRTQVEILYPSFEIIRRGVTTPTDFLLLTARKRSNCTGAPLSNMYLDQQLRMPLAIENPSSVQSRVAGPNANTLAFRLGAPSLWAQGVTGSGVKVVIMDTGHAADSQVDERLNWTDEGSSDDTLGHGTFVASIVNGKRSRCLGMAPGTSIQSYRVFTENRVSFTSWFLDAFNYAIHTKVDVINLSIGGPDFLDQPFLAKINELVANGIILISASGNDGPLYGTQNNPADMSCVIGVGGLNWNDRVAGYSSRGMTGWESPDGYGRIKPDVVTYGTSVMGNSLDGGCRALSGTSVACPVVTGAVTLLVQYARSVDAVVNPASIKQAVLSSAIRLESGENIFEQGAGSLNLLGAQQFMSTYEPHVSAFPAYIDTTECPYFWPYCSQPLYYTGMPMVLNFTILNGMSVTGKFTEGPTWLSESRFLEVSIEHSVHLWPWSGYLSVRVRVTKEGAKFVGTVDGVIVATVTSPGRMESRLRIPLRISITKQPRRRNRLLWDQFHSLKYPNGYFPKDDLAYHKNPFDWNGDHPHTNFRTLYRVLRSLGYYVDILGQPWTCFDAELYGGLLLIDAEEEYYPQEVEKLRRDVMEGGLGLFVAADWYNTAVMKKVNFFDQNTHKWWTPVTGGANVPALNGLLSQFGISFTDSVLSGPFRISGRSLDYSSGTSIGAFPRGGFAIAAPLRNEGAALVDGGDAPYAEAYVVGWTDASVNNGTRIVVSGDSSFLDNAGRKPVLPGVPRRPHSSERGFHVVDDLMTYLVGNLNANEVHAESSHLLAEGLQTTSKPKRLFPAAMLRYSRVMHNKQRGIITPCPQYEWIRGVTADPASLAIDWQTVKRRVEKPVLPDYHDVDLDDKLGENLRWRFLPYAVITAVLVGAIFFSRRWSRQRQKNNRFSGGI